MIVIAIGMLLLGSFVGYGVGVLATEEKHQRSRLSLLYGGPERPVERAQREENDGWRYAADQLGLPRRTVPEPEIDRW